MSGVVRARTHHDVHERGALELRGLQAANARAQVGEEEADPSPQGAGWSAKVATLARLDLDEAAVEALLEARDEVGSVAGAFG